MNSKDDEPEVESKTGERCEEDSFSRIWFFRLPSEERRDEGDQEDESIHQE